MEGSGLGRGLEWSAVTWSADVAGLFPRFRSLTDDMTVLPAEMVWPVGCWVITGAMEEASAPLLIRLPRLP